MNRPVDPEFISAMEAGLQHGREQGREGWDAHWFGESYLSLRPALREKLREEYEELQELLASSYPGFKAILKEAADVANLVMMIADAARPAHLGEEQ